MTAADSVAAVVHVGVGPDEAFQVFTAEIDSWYHVDRNTVLDHTRTKAIVFEPWLGGRLLDVHDEHTGDGRELGRITAWEPGRRLVFVDARETEVEVSFVASGAGSRVTLEHRGLHRLAPDDPARSYGWVLILPWYATALASPTSEGKRP